MPYRMTPYRMMPYRVIPYRMIPYRTMVPSRMIPSRMMPYRVMPYRMMPYRRGVVWTAQISATVTYTCISIATAYYFGKSVSLPFVPFHVMWSYLFRVSYICCRCCCRTLQHELVRVCLCHSYLVSYFELQRVRIFWI